MRRDSRLSVALHVLLHMSEMDAVVTSETLGPLMKSNPVVLRRTLAGLRDAGIVRSDKGHGGGWALARALETVTLADVYAALGMTTAFCIGHRDARPRCLLEQAVNRAIDESLTEAEALLVARLGRITVADVLADARRGAARRSRKESSTHA
jgi:DNA-binding IscR family transcriptional regulator